LLFHQHSPICASSYILVFILTMVQCLATDAKGDRCTRDAKLPGGRPTRLRQPQIQDRNEDGEFDDTLKKKNPATPEKPELNVVKAVEDHEELMQLASDVVGVESDLLTVTTVMTRVLDLT
jgi:hypothetical protein